MISSLVSAFGAGVTDGLNPCGLATVLFFLMFLSSVGSTLARVFGIGALFIGVSICTQFLLSFGIFDFLWVNPFFQNKIHIFYLVFAVVFLVVGFFHIWDWRAFHRFRSRDRLMIQLPIFLRQRTREPSRNRTRGTVVLLRDMIGAVLLAFLLTLISAVYPQSEYIFLAFSLFLSGADNTLGLSFIVTYVLAMVIPLVMMWGGVLFFGFRARQNNWQVSYYKGIIGALYLSVATGLGYFVLTQ